MAADLAVLGEACRRGVRYPQGRLSQVGLNARILDSRDRSVQSGSAMDYVRVFVAQARKRKTQSDNGAALAVVILSESFPCKR
jgi:hypothetical protein